MPVSGLRRKRLGTAALFLALGALVLTEPAYAAGPTGKDQGAATEESGGGDGKTIYAAAKIQYSGSVAKGGGAGNVTSSDVNWTPPPCWYAPYLGAKDFKKKMSENIESQMNTPGMGGHAGAALNDLQRHYEDDYGWTDTPGYKDYNVDKDGKGMFWAAVENPDEPDILKRGSCNDIPFWVDNGEAPPPRYEEAITPEILAALAYQHMELRHRGHARTRGHHQGEPADMGLARQGRLRRGPGDGGPQRPRLQRPGHDHREAGVPEAGAGHQGRPDLPGLR